MGLGVNPKLEALLEGMKHPGLKTIDLSLTRMIRLLEALGNPQDQLPPVIHVAGTNGKGSTIAYLRAMFEAEGKHVHVYTSPHLIRFHERIRIAGELVDDAALEEVLQHIADLANDYPATFFEATTAAALTLFSQTPADAVLLEVGMGGQFDATNVIAKPELCVITPVSLDHCEYLGEDLASIAYEKACIIKQDVPVVVAPQQGEAMKVIETKAAEQHAPLILAGDVLLPAMPALSGKHQRQNACVAVAAMRYLQKQGSAIAVSDDAIAKGLQQANWPARLQLITHQPWLDLLPSGSTIHLDGGHNPAAATMLANWITELGEPVVLICGMLNSKDAKGYLAALKNTVSEIYCVPISDESALDAKMLQNAAKEADFDAKMADSVANGLQQIGVQAGGAKQNVLICGSLYLAGEVLQQVTA